MIEQTSICEQNFLKAQIGLIEEVLFEQSEKDGTSQGHTKNYVKVSVKSEKPLNGCIREVKIIKTNGQECIGELV